MCMRKSFTVKVGYLHTKSRLLTHRFRQILKKEFFINTYLFGYQIAAPPSVYRCFKSGKCCFNTYLTLTSLPPTPPKREGSSKGFKTHLSPHSSLLSPLSSLTS